MTVLSNAERQRRHRERTKEKLRNGLSLRNDDLLHDLAFAYVAGEKAARMDALKNIEEKKLLPYDEGWEGAHEVLANFDDHNGLLLNLEFFIGLVANAGAIMGNRLVMETYREFLIEAQERIEQSAPKKPRKKRVT